VQVERGLLAVGEAQPGRGFDANVRSGERLALLGEVVAFVRDDVPELLPASQLP
jgi:hypothetical protein